MTRLIPLFILLLFATVGCDAGSGPDFNADRPIPRTGESVPEIDAYARAFMAKWDVPGAAYAVRLWLHQGIMPGTTVYLATREDGITVAAVLNTIIEKDLNEFTDDFIEGFSRAVISIKTMPDRDLFPRYFSSR